MLLNPAGLAELFEVLSEGYRAAATALGEQTYRHVVAGSRLDLSFAGNRLAPLLISAFEHLPKTERKENTSIESGLKVVFWDSGSSGVELPLALPETGDEQTRYYLSDDIKLAIAAGGNLCVILNLPRREAVYWLRDTQRIPGYERAAPARVAFHWWFASIGAQLVHAAAVAFQGEAILLVGKSGAGKSTTSLRCMEAGFEFLGDDYCLLTMGTTPGIHSLFGSAKLVPDNLEARLPVLAGHAVNADELERAEYDKAIVFPAQRMSGPMGSSRPIKAIVLPRLSNRVQSVLRPVSPGQALKALAPSSLLQMPGLDQQAFSTLARLVRSFPCYELVLGSDTQSVSAAVGTLWD